MATRRSFSNYKASGDNRWSRTAFKADLIVALAPKAIRRYRFAVKAFQAASESI